MGEKVDVRDRISELPPFIIHHIMSYLYVEEIAQTSVLSKRWNRLWKSFPILYFDQNCFLRKKVTAFSFYNRREKKRFYGKLKEFMKFIDASLLRFSQLNLRMQKFSLFISLVNVRASSSRVDNWIRLALGNEVQEIDLEFITSRDSSSYTLPRTIFTAKSLTTLNLVCCKLEQLCDTIRLYSLKKLSLKRVYMNDEMIQKLANECPLLEDLAISGCRGFKHLCVSKAFKLKIMTVDYTSGDMEIEILQIAVPSLQQLTLICTWKQRPYVIDIVGCVHLQKLTFEEVNLTDQEFSCIISNFPFLEDLIVEDCSSLEEIKISSTQLKNLIVRSCINLKAMDIDTPALLSFVYDRSPILIPSINAPCPSKVCWESEVDIDTRWYLDIIKFLAVSNQIEDLILIVEADRVSLNLDELKESSCSRPCQVGGLELGVLDVPSSAYEALLSGLFWTCHPKTFYVVLETEGEKKFGQWIYEELRKIGDVQCCKSCHIKCWRHLIKDVKMSFLEGMRDGLLYKKLPVHELLNIDVCFNYPGVTLQFHIDWCFPS